ncbi:hypothetical protein BT69DRAFT_1278635 [Atractiella rhizophila]|nr:hypothetical protein BT69DRAFT_1278635 [Atractiella rhizophila]
MKLRNAEDSSIQLQMTTGVLVELHPIQSNGAAKHLVDVEVDKIQTSTHNLTLIDPCLLWRESGSSL